MFIAALLQQPRGRNDSVGPLTDEWISKMWSVHTMKYYSVLKRKRTLPRAVTWVNLEEYMT